MFKKEEQNFYLNLSACPTTVKNQSTTKNVYIKKGSRASLTNKEYQTNGTCSETIKFSIEDDKVTEVEFIGGCDGNSQGVSKLVVGMKVSEVIARLKGIDCDGKGTSCPDQLARALEEYANEK